jgi:urease accessory protein
MAAAGITTITTTMTTTRMDRAGTATDAATLWRLLLWASPAFPVGGFAHSHGFEWAVEQGAIRDAASVRAWVEDALRFGAGRTDAILLAHAHRGEDVTALAAATAPSRERQQEALAQGEAFLRAIRAWPEAAAATAHLPPHATPHAVAFGTAARALPLGPVLVAYLQAFAQLLVSAAVRLVPLGQSDGLAVLAALERTVAEVAAEAAAAPLDELGGACFLLDLAAMRHETQYTRLFRT